MDRDSEFREKIDNIKNQPEIQYDKTSATVVYKGLNLNANNPISPEVLVTVEKQPLLLSEGKTYAAFAVLMDKESWKMKQLSKQAESLRHLPEEQRIKEVLALLNNNVHYAYKDVVSDLYQETPELAKWVETNVGIGARAVNIPFSDIIEKGYGVCSHLSVAYLWLAQKAGLEGTLMGCGRNTIKNLTRTDTGEKLFKSAEVGQPVSDPHMWTEIKTDNNRWIPVDPSKKLIGDSEENLSMFQRANYIGDGSRGLRANSEPEELIPTNTLLSFGPGQETTQTRYSLLLRSTNPITSGSVQIPPTNEPYSGDGKLQIYSTHGLGVMNLAILDVKSPDPK